MNKRQLKKQRKFQTVEVGDQVKILKSLYIGHPVGTIGFVTFISSYDFEIRTEKNSYTKRYHSREEFTVIKKGAKRK